MCHVDVTGCTQIAFPCFMFSYTPQFGNNGHDTRQNASVFLFDDVIYKQLLRLDSFDSFFYMGKLPAIHIITHIIHHPRHQRYTATASQLCTARGDASNLRLKSVFTTFTSPPEKLPASGDITYSHLLFTNLLVKSRICCRFTDIVPLQS